MNRRALKLVITALIVATLGVVAAPGVSIADPISDKQAEAAQLEAQINSNAEKLSALNEQMNSTQNELDKANADIAAADALVAAATWSSADLISPFAASTAFCVEWICSLSAPSFSALLFICASSWAASACLSLIGSAMETPGAARTPIVATTRAEMTSLRARRFIWGLLRRSRIGPC